MECTTKHGNSMLTTKSTLSTIPRLCTTPTSRDSAARLTNALLSAYQHAMSLILASQLGYIRCIEGMEATGEGWFALRQEGMEALSLARDSALPKEFRFGFTSDNPPFVFFSWIWITWIRDLYAEKEAPKALVFSDFLTFRLTPPLPQHNKAWSIRYHLATATSLSPLHGHGGMAFFLFCGHLLRISSTGIHGAS